MSDIRSAILKCIWDHPGIHRKHIASLLSARPILVSDCVRELIGEEWVVEGPSHPVRSGRAPVPLSIDGVNKLAVAAAYSSESLTVALVNALGEVIKRVVTKGEFRTPQEVTAAIAAGIARLKRGNAAQIVGVGLADPGMVNSARGMVVRSSSLPDWKQVPLAAMVAGKVRMDTLIEDSTRARAVGEYLSRPQWRQKNESLLYIQYGQTVGMALVGKNGVSYGAGLAGEIGHVVLDARGPVCRCGARGCLESIVNVSRIVAEVQSRR